METTLYQKGPSTRVWRGDDVTVRIDWGCSHRDMSVKEKVVGWVKGVSGGGRRLPDAL